MISVKIVNADTVAIELAFQAIANLVPSPPNQYDSAATGTTTGAVFFPGPFSSYVDVEGSGFTYNAAGMLVGGTITTINENVFGPPDNQYSGAYQVEYSGLSLAVPQAAALSSTTDPSSVLLAAGATIDANSGTVTGGPGDDVIIIEAAGTANENYPYTGGPTQTVIYGGGGVDTAVFPDQFFSDAVISGSGGDETVTSNGITATLHGIDQIQFIDGTVYENAASPGGQAALMWLGVFGRPEDAINIGGYAQLAEQSGTAQAAAMMLATPEGSADTASLTTSAFVTRLYENILHRAPEPAGLAGWVNAISTGYVDRAQALANFVLSPEAQSVNMQLFSTGALFGGNSNAVDVQRAYETLLGRLPEASSLLTDTVNLNAGISLQDLYTSIQNSAEFAGDGPNVYGITKMTDFTTVYAVAHSPQVTDLLQVSNVTGVAHYF